MGLLPAWGVVYGHGGCLLKSIVPVVPSGHIALSKASLCQSQMSFVPGGSFITLHGDWGPSGSLHTTPRPALPHLGIWSLDDSLPSPSLPVVIAVLSLGHLREP